MIFDVVNRAVDVARNFFESDFEKVAVSRGRNDVDTRIKIYPRCPAQLFANLITEHEPGLGIWCSQGTTSAQWPVSRREGKWTLVFEYVAVGSDVELLTIQAELAAEALLRLIDRLGEDQYSGVVDAGPVADSISVRLTPGVIVATKSPMCSVTITVPVYEEDSL